MINLICKGHASLYTEEFFAVLKVISSPVARIAFEEPYVILASGEPLAIRFV